jgi:A/G-specific adenine glycosylase
MDYGSYLKKTYPNPSRRSKHHARQSRFEGSLRQARGVILRRLLQGPLSQKALLKVEVEQSYRMELALKDLEREGLIQKKGNAWVIA